MAKAHATLAPQSFVNGSAVPPDAGTRIRPVAPLNTTVSSSPYVAPLPNEPSVSATTGPPTAGVFLILPSFVENAIQSPAGENTGAIGAGQGQPLELIHVTDFEVHPSLFTRPPVYDLRAVSRHIDLVRRFPKCHA